MSTVCKTKPTYDTLLRDIRNLTDNCYVLEFSIGRLPTNRAADKTSAEQIARIVSGSRKGVKTSWRMFLDTHPSVAALNRELNQLEKLRASFVVVDHHAGEMRINAAKRLIWAPMAEQIVQQISTLADAVTEAARRVQNDLDSIKENDRQQAGRLWREDAYPENVVEIVGVPRDQYGYIINLSQLVNIPTRLAKEIEQTLIQRTNSWLESTLQTATEAVIVDLQESLSVFLSEVTTTRIIEPPPEHPLRQYGERLEVGHVEPSLTANQVPAGHVRLLIRYRNAQGGMERTWYTLPEEEYQRMNPRASAEFDSSKRVYTSVVQNLFDKLTAFHNYQKQVLGSSGTRIEEALQQLETLLRSFSSAQYLADTVRSNPYTRHQVARVAENVIEHLDKIAVQAREQKPRRRVWND